MGAEQGGMSMFMPMILIFLIFYVIVFRPQKKEQKEKQQMRDNLKKNDQVVTVGGIHGTVVLTKERTVVLRLDDNVKVEFDRDAITSVASSKSQSKS